MKKLILSVVLANLLAACGSAPQKEAVTEPNAAQAVPAPEATTSAVSLPDTTSGQTDAKAVAAATPVAEVQVSTGASATADEALANRSVFFPFDVDTVQTADIDMIMAHGKNLSEHANLKVRVEGNADERGSSEYNLALGQRRANNTKKALVLGGARSDQIETVSYGEEKPRATEHDEAAWAQNRRADIEYIAGQ